MADSPTVRSKVKIDIPLKLLIADLLRVNSYPVLESGEGWSKSISYNDADIYIGQKQTRKILGFSYTQIDVVGWINPKAISRREIIIMCRGRQFLA